MLALVVGAGTAIAAPVPHDQQAPTTSYSFVSAPGDYIGGGQSASYVAPAASISLSGNANGFSMSVNAGATDDWTVDIDAPQGEQLYPGTYLNAERAEFRTGRAPGLDVYGEGRGCNTVYGQFTIDQIAFDPTGRITTLEASFRQNCESATAPPPNGVVRYQAYPLQYHYTSDPGDYIGQGQSQTYTGATSILTLGGTTTGVTIGVSGLRDDWTVQLQPAAGRQLAVGEYDNAQRAGFQQAGHPGLAVFGDGRGCNQDTGSFDITSLSTDANGNVTGLAATFTQVCDNSSGALHGDIRFLAGDWPTSAPAGRT